MERPRSIVLMDLDAFYCSVEVIEQPELRGKPVLIGGSPDQRGVVAAASYEARAFGCHSAMPMARAVRLCPDAVILRPRFTIYREYSGRVMDILRRESDVVQQMSIDEAYVDLTPVTEDAAEAEALAHRIQGRVRVEVGLPCSIGLATSKMVAKIACETGKPSGFVTVSPGQEAAFLAPLSVRMMPGIGPRTHPRLEALGLSTLGDVAAAPLQTLMGALGPWGAVLQRRAGGEDDSPVETGRETKSSSAEETFAEDVTSRERLVEEISDMAGRVSGSLIKHGLVGRTITLKLRYADFTTITRSTTREAATSSASHVREEAIQLLDANWQEGEPIRLIGVGVSNLRPVVAPGQLPFEGLE